MAILTRRRQLAAKIESVEGTAEALAAADVGALIIQPTYRPEISIFKRDIVTESMSKFRSIPGTQAGRIGFRTEVKGSGVAGTPPAMGKFLKACGFLETISAGVSVTYTPRSSSIPSMTIALNMGDDASSGVRRLLKGCRGNVRFQGRLGEPMFAEFEFMGVYVDPTDIAPIGSVTYDLATEPQPLLAAAFTIGSFAAKIENITIDMGNALAMRGDISKAEGFLSCLLTDREPKGNIDPEDTLVSAHNWFSRLRQGTEANMSLAIGATAGNICTITAPKVQYSALTEGDRNKIATLGLDVLYNRSTADDEVQLVFT